MTIKMPYVKIMLCLFGLGLLAFMPKTDDPIDRLVGVLQKWTDSIPQEKVYLHMDKPYYALGDTIWFKGYVTIGSRHQLSRLSGALYVDLISEKDSIIKSLKLPITSGMVMGDFTLGDDYKEGSYRIRAYTQWMRNTGEDYFFDHTFMVGNLVSHNILTKADYQYRNVNSRPVLTALLNYTNDDGKPIAGKNIDYQVVINKKAVWTSSIKTDENGTIPVKIANDAHLDLAGAYIHTTIKAGDKQTIVRDFPIKAALSQSDVQFFPESGNLVNGIASRVAFKAVGVDGLGTPVTGKIVDETNTEVAPLITLHAGMGSFILRPVAGKTYTANISFADGTTKNIALPKAIDEGCVLSVYQPNKDSVLVRIKASVVRAQNLNLIVHTNGETIFSSPVKITNATTAVWLEKKSFPTGIAQFTLFSNTGEPLNERIAFIRSNDLMQLDLKTPKTEYKSKEHVQIALAAHNSGGAGIAGNFSVTVIDESKVPADESTENTILSNILLTADLKGYVEKPNYYFTNDNDEVNRALDNLMLTQGYRRFTWKELDNTVNAKPTFEAEGFGINIAGRVTTMSNKLLPGATINLISTRAKIAKATTTDANGRFRFDGIFLTDSIKFAVQARQGKSDKVRIILDSIPTLLAGKNKNISDVSNNITATLKAYLDNGKKLDDYYEKNGQLDKVHRLREVQIRAKKVEVQTYATQGQLTIPEGHSDQTYKIPNPERCATLGICLQGMLPGIVFKEYIYYEPYGGKWRFNNFPYYRNKIMSVIVDGRLIRDTVEMGDIFCNNLILAEDIVKLEVVKNNQALMGMLSTGPVIMIYTNRGMLKKFYTPSLVNITPKGFNKAREFYSPRYGRPGNAMKLPDLRTTIYWNPYLKTDSLGSAAFKFFNADGPGTYKVIVEGINAAGELGRQVLRYKVNEEQAEVGRLPGTDGSHRNVKLSIRNNRFRIKAK
ncbi:MAG: carboxypeptidase regulatory-like domain-containing protein [Bacteroidota bacterium]